MDFNPSNPMIQLCLQGKPEQAWNEAATDLEKYLAAFFMAQAQQNVPDKLKWSETALQFALKTNDPIASSALPTLYSNLAHCYEALQDTDNASKYHKLALASGNKISDRGPFYHGTKADLQVGDLLTPGGISNYQQDLQMNHIYFTALPNGAGLAAALAKGEGAERVYIIEPTGDFENDPNVTDKKFPGNPTRSFRSANPLRITGELKDWVRQSPAEIQMWRERLAKNTGEIIN